MQSGGARLLSILGLLEFSVFFTEPFNSPGRVNQFLLAGEKGVAFRADLDPYVLLGRTHFNFIPTGTSDSGLVIFWMNSVFHSF